MLGLGKGLNRDVTPVSPVDFSATFNFDSSSELQGLDAFAKDITFTQVSFDSRNVLKAVDDSTTDASFIFAVKLNESPVTSESWSSPEDTDIYARITFYIPSSNTAITTLDKAGFAGYYTANSSISGTDQWLEWSFQTNTGQINKNNFLLFFTINDTIGTGDTIYIDKIELSYTPLS